MTYQTDLATIGRRADDELALLRSDLVVAREELAAASTATADALAQRDALAADKAALVAERNELAITVATLTARVAELEGTQPPPDEPPFYEPLLPIFDIRDYGAKGGGMVDDAPAIKAAFMAAHAHGHGTVSIPPGTYRISTSWHMPAIRTNDWHGQTLPTVMRSGTIVVSGYGATIKYDGVVAPATRSSRFCFLESPNPGGAWSTYGKLRIQGLTFDNGDRVPSGDCGTIVWVQGEQTNIDDIVVRDCKTVNVRKRTTTMQNSCIHGVMLHSSQVSRAQAHASYITNVTVDGCDISAQGKPIDILCPKTGEATMGLNKVLVDNVTVNNTITTNNKFCGTGIHIGSYASGYRCKVTNCSCRDSTDNLIEIDAFNEVLVKGCRLAKAPSGVGFTWFSYPWSTAVPVYTVDDCHYTGEHNAYWPKDEAYHDIYNTRSAGAFGTVVLGAAGTELVGRKWGHYSFANCTSVQGGYDITNSSRPITVRGPLNSVTIKNVDFTDTDSAPITQMIEVRQSAAGGTLPLIIRNCRRSTGGTLSPLTSDRVYITGSRTVDSDIAGLS